MNDSRVVVLASELKRLFRVESSACLKLLLIAFSGNERTKTCGCRSNLQTQKKFYLPNHFLH